jgi:hypothetical protein
MADGEDDDATDGEGDALRSFESVALLAERRDEGRELRGGGGGVREAVVFMWPCWRDLSWAKTEQKINWKKLENARSGGNSEGRPGVKGGLWRRVCSRLGGGGGSQPQAGGSELV